METRPVSRQRSSNNWVATRKTPAVTSECRQPTQSPTPVAVHGRAPTRIRLRDFARERKRPTYGRSRQNVHTSANCRAKRPLMVAHRGATQWSPIDDRTLSARGPTERHVELVLPPRNSLDVLAFSSLGVFLRPRDATFLN